MNRKNSKPADLILRMYESVIFPRKCIHLTGEKKEVCVLYGRMIFPIYIHAWKME